MLIGGILIGLLLGLLAGGSLTNLASIRLRWIGLLLAAVVLRFATDFLLNAGVEVAEAFRLPLLATAFGMLLVGLWANREYPGLGLAFVGVLSNTAVIIVNGGYMPIYEPSLTAAGFTEADVSSAIHVILPEGLNAAFLLRLGPLGDVIPIPLPIIQNVISIGDVFLSVGLAFFLFASVVRTPQELDDESEAAIQRRVARLAAGGASVAGRRDGLLGGASPNRPPWNARSCSADRGLDCRRRRSNRVEFGEGGVVPLRPDTGVTDRIREHPYVRLALNGSFSALWAGQLISLFGDRIHQLAIGVHGLHRHGLAPRDRLRLPVGGAAEPVPLAVRGTFVDRWDKREVLVVSDILRAAVILLIPLAAVTNILLVYPLSFLVTAISVFFRPARVAILPQIVEDDELITANAALWLGETIADVVGYALAGLLVAGLAHGAAARLLAGLCDVPGLRDPARDPGRPAGRADGGRGRIDDEEAADRVLRRDARRLDVPAPRDRAAREHDPGHGRPVHARHPDRPDGHLRHATSSADEPVGPTAVWGFIETAIGARQPASAGSSSGSSGLDWPRAGWSSPATRSGASWSSCSRSPTTCGWRSACRSGRASPT